MSGRGRKFFALILLLILAGVVLGMFFLSEYHPGKSVEEYTFKAEQIGQLSAGDPVKFNGVKVGKVIRIDSAKDGKHQIQAQIQAGVRIPVGSLVRIQRVGLMGERMINVVLSSNPKYVSIGDTLEATSDEAQPEMVHSASMSEKLEDIRTSVVAIQKDLRQISRTEPESLVDHNVNHDAPRRAIGVK